MPRLRIQEVGAGSVPSELLSADLPAWDSVPTTARWLRSHGLPDAGVPVDGPFTRWRFARDEWCRAAGWTRTYGTNGREFTDLNRTNAAGLPQYGSQFVRERFEQAGVTPIEGKF